MNPTSPTPGTRILKGIVFSNVFALISFAVAYTITNRNDEAGTVLVFSEFVLVPIAMGIIAMKYWMGARKSLWALVPYTLLNTTIALLLAYLFMNEGYICLLIVSPLIVAFMWIGVLVGKYVLPGQNQKLKVSTFSILILLFIHDTFSEHDYRNVVADQITINAPVDVVWKYVASHPVNTTVPDYWLFKAGLPQPIQSTVSGDTVGSYRKCVFSNGATFDEEVVEVIKPSVYTFDIVKQPEDPEIIGHIEIRRGQFLLRENPDGTTRLIGKSWYKLRVYPVWYYDLWAEDITRQVHIRVMKHIKTLAENDI